jgi:hypothetical protein
MKKGINLQVSIPDTSDATVAAFAQAFAAANPRLRLTIKSGPGAPRAIAERPGVAVYIEGEQAAPGNFETLADQAVQAALARLPGSRDLLATVGIEEVEHEDEDTGAILAPPPTGEVIAPTTRDLAPPAPTLPRNGPRPAPPPTTLHGCPAGGDGHDLTLNARKNRTDTGPWIPVALEAILAQPWPDGIERVMRANWTPAQTAAVAEVEGLPVQVEGWLAGAKPEGPEACNCHSVEDKDNHLWLVADPHDDRSKSVVIEISPRVRAKHPEFSFDHIRPLVDGRTKIRVSGWLMLDQEHPEQLPGRGPHTTRATLWEIHPIVLIEVPQGDQWVPLAGSAAPARPAPRPRQKQQGP